MEKKEYQQIQTDLAKEIAHGICVSNLAQRVGKELGLPDETCYNLAVAGLLHDIGKLELTKYVYSKDETLQVEEMRYMRTHVTLGYALLNGHGYSQEIAQWVLYHHENYDGTGYPSNRVGDDIPLGARILRVCDMFGALTSERSYRKAFDIDAAMALMIAEVKNFDMKVFLAFQNVINNTDIEELVEAQNLDISELMESMTDIPKEKRVEAIQ